MGKKTKIFTAVLLLLGVLAFLAVIAGPELGSGLAVEAVTFDRERSILLLVHNRGPSSLYPIEIYRDHKLVESYQAGFLLHSTSTLFIGRVGDYREVASYEVRALGELLWSGKQYLEVNTP